jgi:hypothetical protein
VIAEYKGRCREEGTAPAPRCILTPALICQLEKMDSADFPDHPFKHGRMALFAERRSFRPFHGRKAVRRVQQERGAKPEGKNAMRSLAVAAASAIGMGLVSTADVSAMPANAAVVRDAASAMPAAVTPARYYVQYRCYYWRYRYHYRYRCYYYR